MSTPRMPGFFYVWIMQMEPTSSSAAGAAIGWKLIGGLAGLGAIGAGLAALVVICMTPPKEPREWVVALVSTVVSSIGGGAVVVQWLELQHWTATQLGLVALFGLVFACGLPGWAIVRWIFNSIRRREGRGIESILREVRKGGGL